MHSPKNFAPGQLRECPRMPYFVRMKARFSSTLAAFLLTAASAQAQFCNPAGNLAIITNYDGGPLTINVDMDIPNLKIALSSYEPMVVTITGPFASNVTGVWYAGYNSDDNNNHCGIIPTTSISAPAGTGVTIETLPFVTLPDPDGEPWMIYCYLCDEVPYSGNTPAQVIDYFTTRLGGSLLFHQTQYGCYGSRNISAGGNCCLGACFVGVNAGQDLFICEGDTATLSAAGATTWTWSPAEYLSDPLSSNPDAFPPVTTTYVATGTDADGCSGSDTVVVFVNPKPARPSIAYLPGDSLRCDPEASFYFWFRDGVLLPENGRYLHATEAGSYTVFTLESSCESDASEPAVFFPAPSGLNHALSSGWQVFPNPASDYVQVRFPSAYRAETAWQLVDVFGRRAAQGIATADFSISLESLAPGLYYILLGEQGAVPVRVQ
jgi:hypothetical protein